MMTPSQEEIAAALREADLIEDMEMDDTERNLVALASSYRSLVALIRELIASDPEDLGPTCSYVTVQIDKTDYRQALDIAHPVQPAPSEEDKLAAICFSTDGEEIGREMAGLIMAALRSGYAALRAQLAERLINYRAIEIKTYDPSCSLCRDQAGHPRNGIEDNDICDDHLAAIGRAALGGKETH